MSPWNRLLRRLSLEQGRGHGQLVVFVDAVDDGGIAAPTVERMDQELARGGHQISFRLRRYRTGWLHRADRETGLRGRALTDHSG